MRRGWRLRIVAWALVTCATPTVAAVLLGAQSQIFRGGVETVEVTVTVTDADGRLVTGLSKDDFLVFEDGRSQVVTHFTDARVPVSLGILLDISDSMVGRPIADAQRAVDQFVGDRSGLFAGLHPVPLALHLLQGHVIERAPGRDQGPLQGLEACRELVVRPAQCRLGLDPEFS
jgi:hypothetical protein